jgi:hypothetical protein
VVVARRVNSIVGLLLVLTTEPFLMKILAIILLVSVAVMSQTSDRFRSKYGSPISETYLVSPGVLATVKYSKDGHPCSATIAQPQTKTKERPKPVTPEAMRIIVNEFVTDSDRGKLINSGFINLTCVDCESFYGAYEQYEKLRITTGSNGDGNETDSIQWQGVSCDR